MIPSYLCLICSGYANFDSRQCCFTQMSSSTDLWQHKKQQPCRASGRPAALRMTKLGPRGTIDGHSIPVVKMQAFGLTPEVPTSLSLVYASAGFTQVDARVLEPPILEYAGSGRVNTDRSNRTGAWNLAGLSFWQPKSMASFAVVSFCSQRSHGGGLGIRTSLEVGC